MNEAILICICLLLPMKAYHIKAWQEEFENNDSRKIGALHWWPKRNHLVGINIGMLRQEARRVELFCAQTFMEMLACQPSLPKKKRGWLINDGKPLDAQGMAFLTGWPREIFELGIEFFSQPDIAWLEYAEVPADDPELPFPSPGGNPPPTSAKRETGGTFPPNPPPTSAKRETGGTFQDTDRQTDRQTLGESTFPQTPFNKKRSAINGRTQYDAMTALIDELRKLGDDRSEAQQAELTDLLKKRRELQRRQAQGDFGPLENTEAAPPQA